MDQLAVRSLGVGPSELCAWLTSEPDQALLRSVDWQLAGAAGSAAVAANWTLPAPADPYHGHTLWLEAYEFPSLGEPATALAWLRRQTAPSAPSNASTLTQASTATSATATWCFPVVDLHASGFTCEARGVVANHPYRHRMPPTAEAMAVRCLTPMAPKSPDGVRARAHPVGRLGWLGLLDRPRRCGRLGLGLCRRRPAGPPGGPRVDLAL